MQAMPSQRKENLDITEKSQTELNNYFLEEMFLRAYREHKKPIPKRLLEKFNISLMLISAIAGACLFFLNLNEFLFGLAIALIIISAFFLILNLLIRDNLDTFFNHELKKNLNLSSSSLISNLDGFLLLIETIRGSDYEAVLSEPLKGFYSTELYNIRAKGSISTEESSMIYKKYYTILKSLAISIMEKKFLNLNSINIETTQPQSEYSVRENISERQKRLVRNFILEKK